MLAVPRSVRLAAWGNAALAGAASLDTAAEHATGDDSSVRVDGLPGEEAPVSLPMAIGRLRALGVRGLRVALPAPGDAVGLPGPPDFNADAVEAGEAVVTVGSPALGLVPEVTPLGSSGTAVRWVVHPVSPGPPVGVPGLAEADQLLQRALREVPEERGTLAGAAWHPDAAAAVQRLRGTGGPEDSGLAPTYPARAHRVIVTARRVRAIAELAAAGSGGAVSASEMARRTAALAPLERASRRAMAAACNAPLEQLAG